MGSICSSCKEKKTDAIVEPKTFLSNGSIHSGREKSFSSEGEFLLSLKTSTSYDGSVECAADSRVSLCYPLELSQRYSFTFESETRVDFSTKEYRAFCLMIHRKHGALLLHCTRKKKKPPHYQLPGGHIDYSDFKQITKSLSSKITKEQLYCAARIGCAREVYEETGIDFRSRLEALLPMILYSTEEKDLKDDTLVNEYKSRLFFVCELLDEDFPYSERDGSMRFSSTRFPSLPSDFSCDLMLQLSVEHSGFRFIKESSQIANCLKHHSGGKVEKAVAMAYELII